MVLPRRSTYVPYYLVVLIVLVTLQSLRNSFSPLRATAVVGQVPPLPSIIGEDSNKPTPSTVDDETTTPAPVPTEMKTSPFDLEEYTHWFRSNGGIFFFLHVPKTGGSYVKEFLSSQSVPLLLERNHHNDHRRIYGNTTKNTTNNNNTSRHGSQLPPRFFAAYNIKKWKEWQRLMDEEFLAPPSSSDDHGVSGLRGRSVFLESHLQPHPRTLLTKIQEWKRIGKERGVPIFTFAIVRDPLAHTKSWFRFFRVNARRANNTEQDLLRDLEPNLQCSWLVKSRENVHEKCRDFVDSLFWDTMDWVSTTANFDREVLPLVAYLAKIQYRQYSHRPIQDGSEGDDDDAKKNQTRDSSAQGSVIQPPGFRPNIPLLEDLSETTLESIRRHTQVDQTILFDPTVRRYDFDAEWRPFLESKNAMIPCEWTMGRKNSNRRVLTGGPPSTSLSFASGKSSTESVMEQPQVHVRVEAIENDDVGRLVCQYRFEKNRHDGRRQVHRHSYPTGELPPTNGAGVYQFDDYDGSLL